MKSVKGATIQLLSPVLGSVAVVAVAVLGLEVLVTVVLVVVFVLGIVALSSKWSASVQAQSEPDTLRAGPRLSIRERKGRFVAFT